MGRWTQADAEAAAAARDAKLEEAHKRLATAVDAMASGDGFRRAIEFAARFRTRSFNNTLLIMLQHAEAHRAGRVPSPEPAFVAGYQQWQHLGRQVMKGQSGYVIVAPVTAKYATDNPAGGPWRLLARGERAAPDEVVRERLRGTKPVYVWDVTQTEGDPIPQQPMPQLLRGAAPEGLWDGLAAQVVGDGYALLRAPTAAGIAGANGLTDYLARTVTVRGDMDDAAQVKTLAHELGHVRLHSPDAADARAHRGIVEVEAEAVALMIGAAHGLDTSEYSVPYVTSWAGSVPDRTVFDVVTATAERARKAAAAILDALETHQISNGEPPGMAAPHAQRAARERETSRPARRRGPSTRSTVVTR
ncbi:ArdC-like ssDNA-binding domain-containing protein [Georgenia satyanarayanai]|uniref:ArdC-like ssDNA-binding domain-containing protein n=1 Tax=Georgenia satyanarayanai TaxID=860221 RepID=UPI001264EE19|nr:ArdC-like ssDNA-binding domain-containing protein [Georgenia satyanarayanai]